MSRPVCTQAKSCQDMYRPFCFYSFIRLKVYFFTLFSPLFLENCFYEFLLASVGEESSSLKVIYVLSHLQSTHVISTSVISNNRLSRRENLVLVLIQKSKIRLQNIVEKEEIAPGEQFLPFSTIFSIYISK